MRDNTPQPPTTPPEPTHQHDCQAHAQPPFAYQDTWHLDGGQLRTIVGCQYSDRDGYGCLKTAWMTYDPVTDRNDAPVCPTRCQVAEEPLYRDDVSVPRCEPIGGDVTDVYGDDAVVVTGDCAHCEAEVSVRYERCDTGRFEE